MDPPPQKKTHTHTFCVGGGGVKDWSENNVYPPPPPPYGLGFSWFANPSPFFCACQQFLDESGPFTFKNDATCLPLEQDKPKRQTEIIVLMDFQRDWFIFLSGAL